MADALFTLSALSGAWLTSPQSIGFNARSVVLFNASSVPVLVRFASSGDAVLRLSAEGELGAVRQLTWQRGTAPEIVDVQGVGGTGTVYVEASDEQRPHAAVPTLVVGQAAALSSATPAALGSAAAGVATTASRADHVHALPAGTTVAAALGTTASAGVSPELSRVDHVHPLPAGTTVAAALGTSASAGVSPELSRVDHVHPLPAGTTPAAALAESASAGVSPELSRVDHVHPRPVVDWSVSTQIFRIEAPAVVAADSVHAGHAGNDASNAFAGPLGAIDVPRNVSVTFGASWDGGNVTVTGTDQYDGAVSETIVANPGNTVDGVKVFKTVTAIAKAAVGSNADTATVGLGRLLGVVIEGRTMGGSIGGYGIGIMGDNTPFVATGSGYDGFSPPSFAEPNGFSDFVVVLEVQHNHALL